MIKILFEDDYLQVLDKPPGMVVTEIPGMLARLDSHPPRRETGLARLAHRLDKDTSGVLLVAKTPEALDKLQAQFKNRVIKKEYLALVHGEVKEAGKIEGDIGRNPWKREKFAVLEGGPTLLKLRGAREAVTEYEPLERLQFTGDRLQEIFLEFNKIQFRKLQTINYNLFTLLKCFPRTGRTHQIRVHLKYIGHPVVSDDKYAGRKMNRLDRRWCVRQFLHAKKIGFKHPVTDKWMEVTSPLPDDLELVILNLIQDPYNIDSGSSPE